MITARPQWLKALTHLPTHSVVICWIAGAWLTSFFCVFSVLCRTLESSFARSWTTWILHLPSVGLSLIRPSVISRKAAVSQTMTKLSTCPVQTRAAVYAPVIIYSAENFLVSNFIKPAYLFHSFLYPYSKASNLLSVGVEWTVAPLRDPWRSQISIRHP